MLSLKWKDPWGQFFLKGNNNQTDQGDEVVGVERKGLEGGRIGDGEFVEGVCEEIIHCLSLA